MLKNSLRLAAGPSAFALLKAKAFFVSIALGKITTWHWDSSKSQLDCSVSQYHFVVL
jgi:hypothetical protein